MVSISESSLDVHFIHNSKNVFEFQKYILKTLITKGQGICNDLNLNFTPHFTIL